MATHQIERTLEGPFQEGDPLTLALQFYELNQYAPQQPKQLIQAPIEELDLERGKPKAGWHTSDMSQLHTVVKLTYRESTIEITYTIDISGQKLTEADRAFWTRELDALASALCDGEEIQDLSEAETERAKAQRESSISTGLRWGIGLSVVIVLIAFIAKIFLVPAS